MARLSSSAIGPGRIDPAVARTWRPGWYGPPEATLRPDVWTVRSLVRLGRLFRRRGRGFVLRQGLALLHLDETPVSTPWGGRFLARRGEATFLLGVCYEPLETAVVCRLLEKGMTVVDVGANQGWYSVLAARRVGPEGRVLALEPSPKARSALRANLALNPFCSVVEPLAIAASNTDGTAPFVETRDLALAHLQAPKEGTLAAANELATVDTTRLDTLLGQMKIDSVDFVKIDVEGVETRVLEGLAECLDSERPALLVECVDVNLRRHGSSLAELLETLDRLGTYDVRFLCRRHGRAEVRQNACLEASNNLLALPAGDRRWSELFGD